MVGRLTRDPELSYTAGDKALCKFSIANNRSSEAETVSYFDVTTWDKTAQSCGQYLKKGRQVVIQGRLIQSRFQDKNGQNRSKVEINANTVQFIGGRDEGGTTPSFTEESKTSSLSEKQADPFDKIETDGPDEEIPF